MLSEISASEENSVFNSTDEQDENEITFYNEEKDNSRHNKFNFALANARSVTTKLPSLVDLSLIHI